MTVPKFKEFKIEAYKPGKSNIAKIRNVIKLSANESALGVSPRVKKILQNKKLLISKYPDGKAKNLRKEISKKYKCDFEKIICGAGSDEIIQMICQLYLKPSVGVTETRLPCCACGRHMLSVVAVAGLAQTTA